MKRILVVGSLNMDMVVDVDHHPRTGETILGRNIEFFPGGKGANQAYAVARLGGDVSMLGVVGDDDAGDSLVSNLDGAGVDVKRILKRSDVHSGTAFIAINKEGNNSIIVIPGANEYCDIDYIKNNSDILLGCDIILIQMEIPMETLRYVIEKAHALGKTVILNPAPAQKLEDEILAKINYITPNETELEILTGKSCESQVEIREAAKLLLDKGVTNVVVTLGDKGAFAISENGQGVLPGMVVKAVDTTAAGDCFNGAFAVGLAEGKTMDEAILFANKAASISVTRKGAQPSMPERKEVDSDI